MREKTLKTINIIMTSVIFISVTCISHEIVKADLPCMLAELNVWKETSMCVRTQFNRR